ncbi:MAG: histidine kinase, partial [Cyclobacteriaceae bacterium]|nr:histidine kinase [Cyclobacteriaceae bacterium]
PVLLFPGPKEILTLFNGWRSVIEIIQYALLIGYFYLNYHLFTPQYYFRKKYGRLALVTLGMYGLFVILPGLTFRSNPGFPAPPGGNQPRMEKRVQPPDSGNNFAPQKPPFQEPEFLREFTFRLGRQSLLFMLVFLFSLMLRINSRLRETEAARQKAELAYLHAQINPHFLFNTLNSIYSLALQKADATATAVVKLSNMMRYVLTDTVHEKVPLSKELSYLNNYIELQQLRLPASVNLKVNIGPPASNESIAPMLLVPFIENAFKYGINPEQPSEIVIDIKVEYRVLFCQVKNEKVNTGLTEKTEVGIENVRQRLQLLYPQKHTLEIRQSDTDFNVSLSIILA